METFALVIMVFWGLALWIISGYGDWLRDEEILLESDGQCLFKKT
jgi:hypothetical protein